MPIIHTAPDLGSIAPLIAQRSSEICGKERWDKHKETVYLFWDSLSRYFDTVKAPELKIYQDGLMASGELGRKIIEEGAARGSKNHQIVLKLIQRDGEIRKTEDVSLLKKEYDYILRLAQTKSPFEKGLVYFGYKRDKYRLLEERDKFVANTINETLKEGEFGVLFIGVYHDVPHRLASDIIVREVKEREKVKAYFEELLHGRDDDRFNQLAEYLASPVIIAEETSMS